MTPQSTIMSPKKCVVGFLFLQVIARKSLANNAIGMPRPEYSNDLLEATVSIAESCHGLEWSTIGIVGSTPDSLIASFTSEGRYSVVLMKDTTKWKDHDLQSHASRSKLHIFAIETPSRSKLRGSLGSVKRTRWWNHMADFYILDWSLDGNNCGKAFEYLWEAWSMNILRATFICVRRTRGTMMYSFNPYISDAPDPWRLESTHSGRNDHPWSLFVREYSEDHENCQKVSLDKTRDLGGYEIVATVQKSSDVRILPNRTGIEAYDDPEGDYYASMFDSMNASVKLLVHEATEPEGSVDENGTVDGILAETHNGTSDIQLISKLWRNRSILTWTDPFYYIEISAMTQYNGSQSQLKKVLSLFDISSAIGICAICIITFLFFKSTLRQTPTIAFLNTLRLICNSCLAKLPSSTSSRIYLGILLLFVVTIQGIYQGGLSSLLAKRVPLPDIDSIQDLAESRHKIYGNGYYSGIFESAEFEGRFVATNRSNCTEHVLKDSSAACVRSNNHMLVDAARFKLYVSKNRMVGYPIGFVIRRDWPLEAKINMIIQRLVEADIVRYSYDKNRVKLSNKIKANDNENRDRTFKILNFKDLEFAFVILGIGLVGSVVTFIVELHIA